MRKWTVNIPDKNTPIPFVFGVLCSVKKRKKYTNIFGRFRVLKTNNQASGRLVDRLKARNAYILPDFCPKCEKKALLSW